MGSKFADPADALLDDLRLAFLHAWTLPALVGNLRWHRRDKYSFKRPYSELSAGTYPLEYLRVLVQSLIAAVPVTIIILLLLVSLLFELVGWRGPLRFSMAVLQMWHSNPWFRFPSPTGRLSYGSTVLPHVTHIAVCTSQNGVREEEVFYYLNGIVEQGAMTTGTALVLETLTGRMINVVRNKSDGFGMDMVESVLGRSLNIPATFVDEVANEIAAQLALKRRVVFLAHSQGGIVASNVVQRLQEIALSTGGEAGRRKRADLSRLEVYTFCSAAREFVVADSLPIHAEHFASEMDFVARVGVLHYSGMLDVINGARTSQRNDWYGKVHVLRREQPGNGHLVKELVIPTLRAKLFGSTSRFVQRYFRDGGTNPNFAPVDFHLAESDAACSSGAK